MEGKLKRTKLRVPEDLILGILKRLSVKSLVRFKCVSRAWHSLVDEFKFNSKLIVSTKGLIQFVDLEASNIKAEQLDLPVSPHGFRVIGACNGLLCIAIIVEGSGSRIGFLIWNPSTGKHNEVAVSSPLRTLDSEDQIGFGYDPYTDDYKIVRIGYKGRVRNRSFMKKRKFEIYSLKSNSWRKGNLPWKIDLIPGQYLGTVVNGSLYWRINYFKEINKTMCAILHYDLKYQHFRIIRADEIKELAVSQDGFLYRFEICAFDGCLCVVFNTSHCGHCIDFWALRGCGDQEERMWLKMMSIPNTLGPSRIFGLKPVCFLKTGEILMMFVTPYYRLGRRFCIYYPGSNTSRELEVQGLKITNNYAYRPEPPSPSDIPVGIKAVDRRYHNIGFSCFFLNYSS